MWVLGPVGVSGREVSGPLFRVQALNALIDFAVFLVYHINLPDRFGFCWRQLRSAVISPTNFFTCGQIPLNCLGLGLVTTV